MRRGICGDLSILIFEIMSELEVEHQGNPGSTGRSFRPIVRRIQ